MPRGVAATEGATLGGCVSILAACVACEAWADCSCALFLDSTAFFVFSNTNAPGSPVSGFSSMYSSPKRFVRLSDLVDFQERQRVERRRALDEMQRQGQEDGLYEPTDGPSPRTR